MDSQKWSRVKALLSAALERNPSERNAFVIESTEEDHEVRREVISLLADAEEQSYIGTAGTILTPRDRTGSKIAQFEIVEKIGAGGMGIVYKARDSRLDRMVALKFMPPDFDLNHETKTRFVREAKAAATINHPNVATIHEIGEEKDESFIVMEFVEGRELRELIRSDGPLKPTEVLRLATQIAEGIGAAHKKGIVHRDIKPSNVMVTHEGKVRILDFGLAKLTGALGVTRTGTTPGTIYYMSPEQMRGADVDHRTDIWSFGVVLYEMLTGARPFDGDYDQAVVYSTLNTTPDFSAIQDSDLARIVEGCLRKRPEERFQTAEDLQKALEAVPVGSIAVSELLPKRVWHRRPAVVLSLVAAAALVVLLWINFRSIGSDDEAAGVRKMLVVLPFENLGDSENQYFADGMAEELSMRLSSISSLGIISRNTANRYRGTTKSTPEIGKELGVDYVVGGTVRWADLPSGGRSVRIAPYLTRVSDDTQVWAEAYNRGLEDVLGVQRAVALSIVREMAMTLDPTEVELLQAKLTEDPDAYQEYLKGMAILRETRMDSARLATAANHFERAIQLDSLFVEAAYRVTFTAGWFVFNAQWDPADEVDERWKEVVINASNLTKRVAPNSRADLLANGYYYLLVERDNGAALGLFSRALDLFGDADALMAVGRIQEALGNIEYAVDYYDRALALDPQNIQLLLANAGLSHLLRRFPMVLKYRERVAQVDSSALPYCGVHGIFANMIRIDGNTESARAMVSGSVPDCPILDFWDRKFDKIIQRRESGQLIWPHFIAESYRQLGRTEGEHEIYNWVLDQAPRFTGSQLYGFYAWANAGLGNREAALKALSDFEDWLGTDRGNSITQFNTFAVHVYLLLGMYDDMFAALEKDASRPGWMNANWLQMPFFDTVRDDPRYEAVLAKFEKWEEPWR